MIDQETQVQAISPDLGWRGGQLHGNSPDVKEVAQQLLDEFADSRIRGTKWSQFERFNRWEKADLLKLAHLAAEQIVERSLSKGCGAKAASHPADGIGEVVISSDEARKLVRYWKGHIAQGTDIKDCAYKEGICPINDFFLRLEKEVKP